MNSGKMELLIKQGTSLDHRFKFYPFWLFGVEGPDGTKTDVTPKYKEVKGLLLDMLMHEMIVDKIRPRKSGAKKYIGWLHELLNEDLISQAQTRMECFLELHPIYTTFKGFDYKIPFSEVYKKTEEENLANPDPR